MILANSEGDVATGHRKKQQYRLTSGVNTSDSSEKAKRYRMSYDLAYIEFSYKESVSRLIELHIKQQESNINC